MFLQFLYNVLRISLDTNPDTFEVTADTGMTLEVENSNPLWTDSKLQMAYTGATRLEGTLIDLYASNGMYFHSDTAPYYVNNTTHEYKTLATTDQLFSGNYNDLTNKPTIPDAVSGTNDGTNWTSLTIGEDTYGLAGGGTTYNAGQGIDIFLDSEGKVVISNTQTSAEWGNITGDINDQTDLIELIDNSKQDLIAGNGIVIEESSSGSIISLDYLVLDCGTSTINV